MVCVHKITVPFAPNKLLINEVDGNFLCRRLNNNSIALCKNMQMLCVLSKVSVNFCSHLPHGRCGLKYRTKQAYANANALSDFEKYLEKNAEDINNALDVVMYASKQEELRDYTGSYAKLAMIFNGGEIPTQQHMMRSD